MHQGGVHRLQEEGVQHKVRVHLLPQEFNVEKVGRAQKEEEEVRRLHQELR